MADAAQGFATRAIHAGQPPDPRTGAVNVPLYLSSTYAQDGLGCDRGWEYSRISNPTRDALEECLASLEGGTSAHAFASGMAALTALITMFRAGDHVVCGRDMYGGTARLFDTVAAGYGIVCTYVDTADLEAVRGALRSSTRLVHLETPSNPMMRLADIRAVSAICHEHGCELSVDNTFLTPYFQRPLELGADLVMHSTTKYLNGHSDGLGGVLVGTRAGHRERFRFVQKCTGGILSPFEAWLVLRGIKTLGARMREQDRNGQALAKMLVAHPSVHAVYYTGLPSHPQHALACRQAGGFGGMLTFDLGSRARAERFLARLQLCTLAESLGGVETLVSHPATMTHAALSPEKRAQLGITDGLVRLSAGLEDCADIEADLRQALDTL